MICVIKIKQFRQILIELFLVFLIFLAIFLFFPRVIFAKVAINEFSSYGSSDWVEIYRTKTENLSLYYLEDNVGNTKQLSSVDCSGDFCVVDWYNKLNRAGDIVKLFLAGYPSPEDKVTYGDIKDSVVVAPGDGQSVGRNTDGGSNWVIFSTITRGSTNNIGTSAPINISTPTPISTPTFKPPTPTPKLAATYKINEVKDEDGNVLSSVKVYIDGVYLHHHAPEVLTFCDGCQCDTYVDCGYGEHIIMLEKSGFGNWSEVVVTNAGYYKEVNPVMSLSDSVLPTSTPTPIATSTLTPTLTSIPTLKAVAVSATFSGEILGNQSSGSGNFYALETTASADLEENLKDGSLSFLPKVILVLGMVSLLSGGLWLWYNSKYR